MLASEPNDLTASTTCVGVNGAGIFAVARRVGAAYEGIYIRGDLLILGSSVPNPNIRDQG